MKTIYVQCYITYKLGFECCSPQTIANKKPRRWYLTKLASKYSIKTETREHWIQHITFAAETTITSWWTHTQTDAERHNTFSVC